MKGDTAMTKTIAYLRVSTDQQDLNNQKHEIESYAKRRHLIIAEWLEVEISTRKNMHDRRIISEIITVKLKSVLMVKYRIFLLSNIRQLSVVYILK